MSSKNQSATGIILAGGLGTRLQGLHPDVPKPMILCNGRPFIEWVLTYLRQQGLTRFTLSLGYRAEAVIEHLQNRPLDGLEISAVRETEALGTGGAVKFAWDETPDRNVVVSNGDSLLMAELNEAWTRFDDPLVDGVIIGVWQEDAIRYGTLVVDAENRLLEFAEKKPGSGIVNGGIYLLKPQLRAHWPRTRPLSVERDVFPQLLRCGCRLQVCCVSADFVDIGTPESLRLAESFLSAHFPDAVTS